MRTLPLVAWTSFLLATLALLHPVGGPLAPPPLTDPVALDGWAGNRQPVEAVFAVARLLSLGLAWYLLAATVVGTAARLVGARSVVRFADAVTVPLVRRLVNAAVGVSLAAVTLTGTGGTALAEERAEPPGAPMDTMRRLPDVPADTGVPTMRRLPDDPSVETSATTEPRHTQTVPDGSGATAGTAGPGEAGRTWPVRPGEHFWAVAERVLAEVWSRAPADSEVDSYWRTLVDANRAQLRDPGNPDLLFPGQVIALPPPPPPPAPSS